MRKIYICLSLMVMLATVKAQAQQLIDEVVAVVGDEMIMRSEPEAQLQQAHDMKGIDPATAKCNILSQLMERKLLLARSKADSLKVSDEQVESELGRRIDYFVNQPGVGSVEKLEQYYSKTISEIKNEFRHSIKEQLLADQMQSKVIGSVDISPADVKKYYNSLPSDSLPYYNTEVEVAQIILYPKVGKPEKEAAIEKLKEIRQEIMDGAKFSNKAIVFSQDNGSALKGGDLGMTRADNFVPEFSAAALKLKKDSISGIVESKFGFHIIQMLDRKGELIHVRHILIKPEISEDQRLKTKEYLDSLRAKLILKDISFKDAVAKSGSMQENKNPEGLMTDPKTNTTKIPVDELDGGTFFIIDKLNVGDISQPVPYTGPDGREGLRLVMLKSKTAPHKANIKDDYPRVRQIALEGKKMEKMKQWYKKYIPLTFIRVDDKYKDCEGVQKFISK